MSLNHREITLILDELQLEGWWIQKITQPTHCSLLFHLYKNAPLYLYVNLASGETRLHSIQHKMPKEEKLMRFVQLLRSKVVGAKIEKVRQINDNRIVLLSLNRAEETYHLYIKLWSNASNIILTKEDDTIIDVFYRREGKGEKAKAIFTVPERREDSQTFEVREYDRDKSFNEYIEQEYAKTSRTFSRTALLIEAEKLFNAKKEKINKILKKLEQKEATFANNEELKHMADLITSNIFQIKKGNDVVTLFDYESNKEITIKLDKLKTAQENAQEYYSQYKKAVSGLEKVKDEIESYKREIAELKQNYSLICTEEDAIIMSRMLEKEKKKDSQKEAKDSKQIGLRFIVSGWHILVGRSNKENDALLRHSARGSDIWLHTRDYPGGFVFIKAQGKGKSVPQNVLIAAGNLAVFYSKARRAGEADLYTTQVKNLRRAKDAPLGTVLPYHEKNMFIKLDQKIINDLKSI